MKFHRYIACLCEGSTEETIMNLLLDADLLKFQRNDLLEEKPLRIREADAFERRYLRREFQQKLTTSTGKPVGVVRSKIPLSVDNTV